MAGPNLDKGRCFMIIRIVKWIPVLFISLIIFWSYYAYVVELCFMNIESIWRKILFLILYHIFFFMLIWAYWQTIYTDIGRVPSKYKIDESDFRTLLVTESIDDQRQILEKASTNLPNANVNIQGSPRFCEKCKVIKPDRTHHCSVCRTCVLKMDHHCPWVNNCVCFTNYKFFILFLGYSLLYCIYVLLTSLPYFIAFWRGNLEGMGRFHILFLFFVALMFGVSLISLFCYHIYLIFENRTTLEAFRPPVFRTGPDKRGFHIGKYNNFQEVFGSNPKTWFIPVYTSLGDGVTFPQRHMDEDQEGLLHRHNLEESS